MATSVAPREGHPARLALDRLIEGNRRFMRGEARFPTVCKETLAALAKAQNPFATILGCSDSRVPPELIFDANFGELFIIRVAGNVVSPEVKASLQYAGRQLGTPLFMVLGHQNCGAVQAALRFRRGETSFPPYMQLLIENINEGLHGHSEDEYEDPLGAAVEANVRWSMAQIECTPAWQKEAVSGALLVGAVFKFSTGEVSFL